MRKVVTPANGKMTSGQVRLQVILSASLLSHVKRLRRDRAKRRQCKKATLPVQGSLATSGDHQACAKAKKAKNSERSSFVSSSGKKARVLKPADSEA